MGNFLKAASLTFKQTEKILGFEINSDYITQINRDRQLSQDTRIQVAQKNFFDCDWYSLSKPWQENILFLGNLHKKLNFQLILPYQNQPVIVDDTVYFLSFEDLDTAQKTLQLLNSSLAMEFYSSLIFWDEKRPIKTRILNSLNLSALVRVC
jgi:hypothetical protein